MCTLQTLANDQLRAKEGLSDNEALSWNIFHLKTRRQFVLLFVTEPCQSLRSRNYLLLFLFYFATRKQHYNVNE